MIRFVPFDRGHPEAEFYEEQMPCDLDPYRKGRIPMHGRRIVARGKDELEALKVAHRATSGKDSFMFYIGKPGIYSAMA